LAEWLLEFNLKRALHITNDEYDNMDLEKKIFWATILKQEMKENEKVAQDMKNNFKK
jgi:hypothetical protein